MALIVLLVLASSSVRMKLMLVSEAQFDVENDYNKGQKNNIIIRSALLPY